MKNKFAKFLLTTCLGISIANGMESESLKLFLDPCITTSEHKQVLKDFDLVDYNNVKQYRQAYSKIEKEDKEFVSSPLAESMDCLIPLAQKGLEYVQSLKEEFPQITILENEIISRIDSQNVTPLWSHLLAARIQAAISVNKLSEDEIDVYSHVPGPGIAIIKALMHKDAWKSYEQSTHLMDSYRKPQAKKIDWSTPSILSYEDAQQILGTLEKQLPATVFWSAYGQGKLS